MVNANKVWQCSLCGEVSKHKEVADECCKDKLRM